MSEGNEIWVPAAIPTAWDEDGEATAYKPVQRCTREEIKAYLARLYGEARAEALDRDHINLGIYAAEKFGKTATDPDD